MFLHFYACSKDIKPLGDCHAEFLICKTTQKLFLKNSVIMLYFVRMEPIFF